MKTVKCALKTRLASVSVLVLVSLLAPVSSMAQIENPSGQPRKQVQFVQNVPNVVNPDGTPRYGPNIINTDSHAIVLNAADLGFVRNQFIRCVDPANAKSTNSCAARNPKIYTYLENYPVAPFSGVVVWTDPPFTCSGPSGGVVESVVSCFPTLSGYPTDP